MASREGAASLGAVFHDLRAGLGDRGGVRVNLEYRFESTTAGLGLRSPPQLFVRRALRAELDSDDGVLTRAHIVSTGMSPRPLAELTVVRHGRRYLYSPDGGDFGLLVDAPRLFDIHAFESRLCRIPVVTVDRGADVDPDGSAVTVAGIVLDDDAFRAAIRLFGDDPQDQGETLEATGRSMLIRAGADVGLHYRWTTSREERTAGPAGERQRFLARQSSRVSVRLRRHHGALPEPPRPVLPELGSIEDLWERARQLRTGRRPDPVAGVLRSGNGDAAGEPGDVAGQ